MEMTTDDVFGPDKEPEKEPAKEPEVKEPETEPTDEPEPEPEKEPEKDKGEPEKEPEAPTPGEKPPKGYVPLAAIEDERKKRQENERKAKEYERQLQELQQRSQKAPPGFMEDPEGYVRRMQEEFNQRLVERDIVQSQELMRSTHKDYDEMELYLTGRVEQDPLLAAQVSVGLANSPNTAKFAYDTAKRLKRDEQFDSAGGLDKWQAQQREELKKQILEELKANQSPQSPEVEAPPESLAAAGSSVTKEDTFKPPSTKDVFEG